MAFARFIDTDYIFKYSIVDNNVDPDLLIPFITKAQDLNIQSVLGNNLYTKIMNDIDSTGTTTGSYLTLLTDYIQRATLEWTIYHALPYINYRITNKALSQKNSDNSNPSGIGDIQYLREQMRNDAEFYSTRIREYIINNQTSFPEYFLYGPNLLQIRPRSNNYFSGIYLKRDGSYGGNHINIWGC